MTGRNDRGVSPGRGFAGVIAAAVLLALGAQGAVGAPSDKKQRDRSEPAATGTEASKPKPAPTTQSTGMVTRSVGRVQVAIDPATGKVQQPTPEQAAALAAELEHMLSRETEELSVTELPDGTLLASLDDSFQEVAMASVDQRGRVRLHCVGDAAQAMSILNGTARVSPDAPVYTRVRAEKARGAKVGRDPVVKE
jgi:hypothetical protein